MSTEKSGGNIVATFLGAKDEKAIIPLVLVHINLIIYALAFWMQQPVLPFLSKELGADQQTFGYLTSAVGACALVGGPFFGRIVDERGAKTGLILAQFGSLLMYTLMSVSYTLPILFLSRIPAVVQHCMLCSQAAVALLSTQENRAVALGRLSLSYAAGMTVGAPLGGTLTKWYDGRFAAFLAALVTLAVFVANILFLPSSLNDVKQETVSKKATDESTGVLGRAKVIYKVAVSPNVRVIAIFSLLFSLALTCGNTLFNMASNDHFGMNPQEVGFYMAYASGLALLGNIFTVGAVIKKFGDTLKTLTGVAFFCSITYVMLSGCSTITMLAIVSIPKTQATSVLYTLMGSVMSKAGSEEEAGTRISLSHALRSACGIIAPIITGFLYQRIGYHGPALFSAAAAATAAGYLYSVPKQKEDKKA